MLDGAHANVSGLQFVVRPYTSDTVILDEVINRDYYKLRDIFLANVDVQVVIDVGAHIGAFTVLVKTLWPACRVVSIEASLENYLFLVENTHHLAGVMRTRQAIAAQKGVVRLSSPHRLGDLGNTGAYRVTDEGEYTSETCLLSEILNDFDSVDVLKLDCEGCEYTALWEAFQNNQLMKVKWVIGEWHGSDPGMLLNMLRPTHDTEVYPNRFFRAWRRGM